MDSMRDDLSEPTVLKGAAKVVAFIGARNYSNSNLIRNVGGNLDVTG